MKKYKPTTPEEEVIMSALEMCKAHTRWKTGKGSAKSFSKWKGKFIETLREVLDWASQIHR